MRTTAPRDFLDGMAGRRAAHCAPPSRRAWRGAVLAGLMAAMVSAAPGVMASTFTWATANDILGLDPHANNHGVTNAMKSNMYEPLVRREPDGSLAPALAERWETVSPTLWRFHLRRNVRFHGGESFTAADVVHSIERVRQNDMAYTAQSITAARAVDEHTVEIETRGPNPVLLQDLTLLFITSKAWIEANNAFAVARAGQPGATSTFVQLNANGTGPFRLVERLADERTVLVPNPNWWEPARHGITRAVFRPVASAPTRVAALLSRELDVMYHVPLQDIPRIQGAPGVRLQQGPTARSIYLGFDTARPDSLDAPGTPNPLRDVRVRRAIYQAIDMGTIGRVVLRGSTVAAGLPIGAAIGGFDAASNDRLPFDAEAARRLLAEAGFPQGFRLTLGCPNNRYINDEAICQSIVSMLQRVGIQARLEAVPFGRFLQRGGNREFQFWMLGWAPGNFDITNPGRELLGEGSFNWGGFADEEMARLLREIAVTPIGDARQALARQYWARFRELLPMVPLHQEPQVFGVRETVAELPLRVNEDVELRIVRMR
jgi:peptide/nickel transport system substrate-binding protein